MESIQSQWCATRPRSPSIGSLSSGKPVLQGSLGRGWGLGDRVWKAAGGCHAVKEQIKLQPPITAAHIIFTRLHPELTGERCRET